jgi:Cu(I)/Ag(I) efflux system membrane protein CusA/SilA
MLAKSLTLPPGYSIEWTGLYEYAAAARARLRVIVPLTIVIIFGLLVVAFKSVAESVLILLSVPFAMVGGVFLGVPGTDDDRRHGVTSRCSPAVQTGIIMVIFIRFRKDDRRCRRTMARPTHEIAPTMLALLQ